MCAAVRQHTHANGNVLVHFIDKLTTPEGEGDQDGDLHKWEKPFVERRGVWHALVSNRRPFQFYTMLFAFVTFAAIVKPFPQEALPTPCVVANVVASVELCPPDLPKSQCKHKLRKQHEQKGANLGDVCTLPCSALAGGGLWCPTTADHSRAKGTPWGWCRRLCGGLPPSEFARRHPALFTCGMRCHASTNSDAVCEGGKPSQLFDPSVCCHPSFNSNAYWTLVKCTNAFSLKEMLEDLRRGWTKSSELDLQQFLETAVVALAAAAALLDGSATWARAMLVSGKEKFFVRLLAAIKTLFAAYLSYWTYHLTWTNDPHLTKHSKWLQRVAYSYLVGMLLHEVFPLFTLLRHCLGLNNSSLHVRSRLKFVKCM